MPEQTPGWVEFLNREAQALGALANLPKDVLRGHLRDRMRETYRFPLRLELRCLVVGERYVEAPAHATPAAAATAPTAGPAASGSGGATLSLARQGRHLEVVPEGITREAAALTGPILIAVERLLQEGSVVRVQIDVEDPDAVGPGGPALTGRLLDLRVDVAVEP